MLPKPNARSQMKCSTMPTPPPIEILELLHSDEEEGGLPIDHDPFPGISIASNSDDENDDVSVPSAWFSNSSKHKHVDFSPKVEEVLPVVTSHGHCASTCVSKIPTTKVEVVIETPHSKCAQNAMKIEPIAEESKLPATKVNFEGIAALCKVLPSFMSL